MTEGYADRNNVSMLQLQESAAEKSEVIIWHPEMDLNTIKVDFVVGICGGPYAKEEDMDLHLALNTLSNGKLAYVSIDKKVGGYVHDLRFDTVAVGLQKLIAHPKCVGTAMQPPCKWFSALLCIRPGPNMLFSSVHPDGILNLRHEDKLKQELARNIYGTAVKLARGTLEAKKFLWWEGPVSRAKDSQFHIEGQDEHSTAFELTCVKQLITEYKLKPVYMDQGSFGATSPKTTVIYCSEAIYPIMQRIVGTAKIADPTGHITVGFDQDGNSRASQLERYPPNMMQALAKVMWEATEGSNAGKC